jgi:hypothetical protein
LTSGPAPTIRCTSSAPQHGPCRADCDVRDTTAGLHSTMTATRSFPMMTRWQFLHLSAGRLRLGLAAPASAQQTIRIGELNSYKAQPAFLEPYKKGMELAVDEINAPRRRARQEARVISRDDGAQSRRCRAGGRGARHAREASNVLAGTFLSNIGLASHEFAGKKKVFFLAAEPLTDKITWQNGNSTRSACAPRPTCRSRC